MLTDKILRKLKRLQKFNLDYITQNRAYNTLSSGEKQRLRLAMLAEEKLTDVLYILDEPANGLYFKEEHLISEALKELIDGSIELSKMRGGKKEAAKEEQVTIDFAFATVVSIAHIKKGEVFTKENIWVKRPGTGEITAESYQDILGRTSLVDIQCDTHVKWSDINE